MRDNLRKINVDIEAYERMIADYSDILEKNFDGDFLYMEDRLHLLNCVYTDLLLERIALHKAVNSDLDSKS